jgi:hypothetical protein
MDYQKAKDIRGKRFSELMTDKLVAGEGIGSSLVKTLSERSKARSVGLKQKFDPLNIAKILTGGSRLGPAILGKITGASQERMSFFAGDPKKKKLEALNSSVANPQFVKMASESLGNIYDLLKKDMENKKLQQDQLQSKEEEQESEEDKRNQELIKALTARVKPKAKKKKEEQQIKKESEAKTPTPAPTATKKGKAPKPTAPAAPKPTAPAKAPKTTAAKIGGAAAIIGTVGLIGKESLASNIAKYESGKAGYNAYNKGTIGNKMIPSDKPIDFSKITIAEYLKRGELKKDDPDRLFAVGRYQIIPPTMKDLIKQMNIDPNATYLDAATQDALFTNGLVGQRRKKVDNYVKGKSDDRDGAILELAKEFASVGVPYDMEVGNKKLKKGDSYYSGVGGNKAHNSPEEVGTALDNDRSKNLQNNKSTPEQTNGLNIGNQIDVASKENKDLKSSLNKDRPKQTVVNNTNISSETENANQGPEVVVDDRPAPLKKKG